MDLPLELDGLRVTQTADNSSTRLLITAGSRVAGTTTALMVADVQELAGTLLQWLADNGHELPELPATEADLEDVEDWATFGDPTGSRHRPVTPTVHAPVTQRTDPDSRPLPHSFGELYVLRVGGLTDGIRIEKADPWIVATTELLDQLRTGDSRYAVMDGLDVTITDSEGRSTRYRMRPDVATPDGAGVVLQQTQPLQPATVVVPEHTRG